MNNPAPVACLKPERDFILMDPTVSLIEYIGFVVAALIIIWAVIELGRRMYPKKNIDPGSPDTWARLNSILPPVHEETLSDVDDEEGHESDIQTRAKQNGHYSESKKPL